VPGASALLTISFVAGAIPAHLLLVIYGLRVRWRGHPAGWTVFVLFLVMALSYDLSLLALIWPATFKDQTPGVLVRVLGRFLIAAALYGLLALLIRVQRDAARVAGPDDSADEKVVR
jgi:hypothetical protein